MTRFFLMLFLVTVSAIRMVAQQTMPLIPNLGRPPVVTGNTAVGTATLTPGQMSTLLTGTPTAAATYTTPTATLLCRLFPTAISKSNAAGTINFWWEFYVKNTSAGANTITMAGGTGVTTVGTMTAAQNAITHFLVVLNNCGATPAAQLISLGTSTF